ncbi:MAG: hypothetical protein FWF44_06500 [Defluviitaleaceae bacterium]|nr:hypothetical protein [Defluviitaleaceae bacterium]
MTDTKTARYRELIEAYFTGLPIKSFETSFDQGLHNDLIFLNKELVVRFAKDIEY